MEPKLFFWIDSHFVHYFLAKSIKEKMNCKIYSCFEITDKPKKYFEKQNLVDFEKFWFLFDHIEKNNEKPDLEYLKNFEDKYKINLWLLAFNDRFFYKYNEYYTFSTNEKLKILEQECKFFEKIIEKVKPDFLISFSTHQQQNDLFYRICKAKKIKILLFTPTHVGNAWAITDDYDKFEPFDTTYFETKNLEKIEDYKQYLEEKDKFRTPNIIKNKYQQSKLDYLKAALNYVFSENSNVKSHFTYYGRNKLKVIQKMISYELKRKSRKKFMDKNLKKHIDFEESFIYFPLHQEIERNLLLGAPFHLNQVEMIRQIAQSLPIGYKLLVKDHTVMESRGWRKISQMKEIMEMANVKLVHPEMNSYEIFPKCSIVITIGGTASIEAAFFNKPSISFREVGHIKLPSIKVVKNSHELPSAIRASLNEVVNPEDVSKFLTITHHNSINIDFFGLMTYFMKKFNFGGFLADTELPEKEMEMFFKNNKDKFDFLALEHIKRIKKMTGDIENV